MTRIYQAVPLTSGATLRLDDKASHHLAKVLRASVGEALVVFNGQGCDYGAVITAIDKKGVEIALRGVTSNKTESPLTIHLAQGIARGEKMDMIIQKAVELGVNHLIPLVTERCNVRLQGEREEKRLQHWQAVMVSACEQSGRAALPTVSLPMTLSDWLQSLKTMTPTVDYCFVLSPHVVEKMPLLTFSAQPSVAILVGPEGGLSHQEVALAVQHGCLPLHLGPRVLRTETAALAAVSVLQYCYGDFS